MLIWPGIQLFGCTSAAKAVRNGCLYTVESVDTSAQTLVVEGVGTLTFDQAKAWLRLSHAQTYASCQGTEFADSLCLWDTAHRHFTRKHLFVGLSRARVNAVVNLRD